MDSRIEAFLTNADRFAEVAQSADQPADWGRDSPCEGWEAADVVSHVVETQRDFLGERGAVLPPTSGGGAALWESHLDGVRTVVADDAFTTEGYDGYFGPTIVADTLKDFYGFDLIVHRWDLARSFGHNEHWSAAEMDAVETSLDGFGDSLYADGICKSALDVADDAPRQERLLARMGRRA